MYIKKYLKYLENTYTNIVTIKKGEELFHSTIEDFNIHDLKVGSYDSILWTTKESAISQTYIPISSSKIKLDVNSIIYPSKDQMIQKIQKELEIIYTYSDVEFDIYGNYKSFSYPKVNFELDEDNFFDELRNLINNKLINEYNYIPISKEYNNNNSYTLYMNAESKLLKGDEREKGRLFIMNPTIDLKIYDISKSEGDLQNLQYHKIDLFRDIENRGFHGVKINDFAQIEDMGNFGHESYGLFSSTIKYLNIESIIAEHPRDFYNNHYKNNNYESREYKKFKTN